MKWGSQVLQPPSGQVPPQLSTAACSGLSTVFGPGDPGNRLWRYQQGGGAEGPGFGNWNPVLGWRSLSLTRGQ